jgi:hypothetical protein
VLFPIFAQESNYIKMNKDEYWSLTKDTRLIKIINNPVEYNPEEFIAALHEYSKRHGTFMTAQNSLEAFVNAYIAKNPNYMSQATENVFAQVGKNRGVQSLQTLVSDEFNDGITGETSDTAPQQTTGFDPEELNRLHSEVNSLQTKANEYEKVIKIARQQTEEAEAARLKAETEIAHLQTLLNDAKTEYLEEEMYNASPGEEFFPNEEIGYDENYIHTIIENYEDYLSSFELIYEAITDDGIRYTIYQINENITVTIPTDINETQYAIAKIKTVEAMNEAISYLTDLFPVQINNINGGVLAFYLDTDNLFITDEMNEYTGTITFRGSQMFVEEVIPKNKIIMQRQWCTEEFYDVCTLQLGEGWGFIASWDIEE